MPSAGMDGEMGGWGGCRPYWADERGVTVGCLSSQVGGKREYEGDYCCVPHVRVGVLGRVLWLGLAALKVLYIKYGMPMGSGP